MEASLEADHRGPLRVGARKLDSVLDGFRAGVEERGFCGAGDRRGLDQTLGERDVRLVGDDREVGMEELRGLFLHCIDDARMRMADVQAADASGEVEERVPVDVRQRRALAPLDHHGQIDGQRIRDHAVLPVEDLLRAGARDPRLELDRLRRRHLA